MPQNIFADVTSMQIFCIVFWIIMFLVALSIELSTTQLVSIWFCGGALVSLILAICNVEFLWQGVVWVIVSGVLLLLSKVLFKKKLDIKATKTNSDSLVGEEILVISKASRESKGEGKIRDIVWTIQTDDPQPIEEGEFAIVKKIEGNKLIVTRKESK